MGSTNVGNLGVRIMGNINGKVQQYFTNMCDIKMNDYIPMQAGMLRRLKIVGLDAITYYSPYARYQYYGKLMVDPTYKIGAFYDPNTNRFWSRKGVTKELTSIDLNYHTPGTGAYWDKAMKAGHMKEITQAVEKYANEER